MARKRTSGRRKRRFPLARCEGEPLDLDQHLPFQFAVLANLLRIDRDPFVRRLTALPSRELRVLINIGSYGPIRAADVAYQSRLGTPNVSRAVRTLIADGLARATPDRLDQRVQLLELTPAGTSLYRPITDLMLAREVKIAAVLSAPERALLSDLLERLEDRVEEVLGEEALEVQQAGEVLSADQSEILRWYRRGAV